MAGLLLTTDLINIHTHRIPAEGNSEDVTVTVAVTVTNDGSYFISDLVSIIIVVVIV